MVSYYRKKLFDTQYHILHDDRTNILEKLDSINDLGVTFDNNLSFKDHMSQKINKAYSILGIIKRNFIYMDMLILCATDVPYTDVYNTRPRLKFTAYSLGGPLCPQFLYTRPQMSNIKVSFTDRRFSVN